MGNATRKKENWFEFSTGLRYKRPPVNQPQNERLQSFVEHLGDLRSVLIRSVIALSLGFFVCFHYVERILAFLKAPILQVLPENHQKLYYFNLTEQFYTHMKVSLIAAIFVTFPFLLLQLWNFISPALKPQEKKLAVPFLLASIFAFLVGFYCAYQWAIPYLFKFLIGFNQGGTEVPLIRLGDYVTLILQLLLATALIFETPVILSLLGRLGIITAPFLKHIRPKAYVGLTILAAVLTPTPDAFTMVLALVPLVILYEVSVALVELLSKPAI